MTFVATSLVLFAGGATLAYFFLHHGLEFLLNVVGGQAQPLIGVNAYLGFFTTMLLVFGVAFELPLVVVMLNFAGVLSYERLRNWRRAAIFLVFAFAAVATPSQDPFTMIAMAVPMSLLYEAALVVARIHDRRVARRASPYAGLSPDEPTPQEMLAGP
jgi:sec-independent protein translocase protein TatC